MKFQFREDRKKEAQRIVKSYPSARSAILPLLWLVQGQEGYVSREAAECVAGLAGVEWGEVEEVASFYEMIRRERGPVHVIRTCRGICCAMKGAAQIESRIRERLGIGDGGVSEDGRFGLEISECLGLCDRAPAIMVGDECFGNLTAEGVDAILRDRGARF